MSSSIFSKAAENDLLEIYRYSFLNYGKDQAEHYVKTLKEKCQLLSSKPMMCRERKEFTPPVRIHHHNKHLIIYTIEQEHIFIVRLCHERMDISNYLENG